MLEIERDPGQEIHLRSPDHTIVIRHVGLGRIAGRIRLAIDAPSDVLIRRPELDGRAPSRKRPANLPRSVRRLAVYDRLRAELDALLADAADADPRGTLAAIRQLAHSAGANLDVISAPQSPTRYRPRAR